MAPKTSKSKSKLKLKSKSPKSNLKQRKSTSKFGGSLPRSNPLVHPKSLNWSTCPTRCCSSFTIKYPKAKTALHWLPRAAG